MAVDMLNRPITDPIGAYDDGTAEGAVRAKLVLGELVKIPFVDGHYYVEGTLNSNGAKCALQTAGQYALGNSDGSNTVLSVVNPTCNFAGGVANMVRIWVPFLGRRFGLRYLGIAAAGYSYPPSIWIDGVSWDVGKPSKANPVVSTEFSPTQESYIERTWMCPEELQDIPHVARIHFPASPIAAGTSQSYLTGLMLERRPGIQDPLTPRAACAVATGTLTNAYAAIPITGNLGQNDLNARYVSRIDYCNVDSSAHQVLIQVNATTINQLILPAAGTAGCAGAWDFKREMAINGGTDSTYDAYVTHKADAGGVVNFAVWGGAA